MIFSWFKKKQEAKKDPVAVIPPVEEVAIKDEDYKDWEDFSKEDLIKIAKMVAHCGYGNITLNFNDTFAYACAWGVDCDEFDLLPVSELYEKYGVDGVIAWGAVKEEVEKPIGPSSRFPRFKEAKAEIEANKGKYFWQERYKQAKEKS